MAETAITEAPTVPADIAELGGKALHALYDGIPPEQDRCDCPTEAAHNAGITSETESVRLVLEAAWPAITAHFAKLGLLAHGEGMRALVDTKTELEGRVEELRQFEREYGNRLRAALNQDIASLQTMLDRLDGDLPSPHDVRVYLRRTGWVEGRVGRAGSLWTRPDMAGDSIGLVYDMAAGDERWQSVVARLAKANGLPYAQQITAIKDSQESPR